MTKTKLLNRCKELLNSGNLSYDDKLFLITIFKNHQHWEQKKGSNPKDILIEKTPFGNNCFFILREDGTKTDISYIKSLSNPKHKTSVLSALRYAVKDEIFNFKNNNVVFGETKCEISKEVLFKHNCHIDHYDLTFFKLSEIWINKIGLENIKLSDSVDNSFNVYLLDKELERDFIKFHNNNTNLRAVTNTVNLRLTKK